MRKADVIGLIIKNKGMFPHLFPPPTAEVAKKVLAKKIKKKVMKTPPKKVVKTPPTKKDRKRVYRFRVDGKEFKKTNDSWARIIENPGGLPIKQQPKLWSASANLMYSKLRTRGLLSFSHNIKTATKKAQSKTKPYQPLMLL